MKYDGSRCIRLILEPRVDGLWTARLSAFIEAAPFSGAGSALFGLVELKAFAEDLRAFCASSMLDGSPTLMPRGVQNQGARLAFEGLRDGVVVSAEVADSEPVLGSLRISLRTELPFVTRFASELDGLIDDSAFEAVLVCE